MDWTGVTVSVEPTAEPVTVDDLKTYMRLDSSTYDDMLEGYIKACRQAVEKHTGLSLMPQTRQLFLDDFPDDDGNIELPYGPVRSVSSVTYLDADGDEQTLATSVYRTDLNNVYPRIGLDYEQEWPETRGVINSVTVTYTCGYAHGRVPQPIKQCIKALASDLFEHPESNVELTLAENRTYKFLLNAYTVPGVA